MFFPEGIINQFKPFFKSVADKLFVADAQVFKAERFRVAGHGTHPAPRGGSRTIGKFCQVEDFQNIIIHFFHRKCLLSPVTGILAADGCRKHRQRFSADILTKLKNSKNPNPPVWW